MAKFSYEEFVKKEAERTTSNLVYASKYLKDDGDTLIVRLPYKSLQELDYATVHSVVLSNGNRRTVSCLRGEHDSVDACPLCKASLSNANYKPANKFYLKGIAYLTDETGKTVPSPFVFERPAKFSAQIIDLINEYGDLSNFIFKLKRTGKKGDTKTTYSFIPALNATIYNEQNYPKDFSELEKIDVCKRSYMEKSFEDITTFLRTGEFPQAQTEQTTYAQPQQTYAQPTPSNPVETTPNVTAPVTPVTPMQPQQTWQMPQQPQNPTQGMAQAEENPFSTQDRPRRIAY